MNVPSWKSAARWAAACSLLFMCVYGATNTITSWRSEVGTWVYDWERHIPFLPWMIIPYWSIDLLFVAGFFLCRSRAELDTLGRRIGMAILVAGACFLVFPLRLAASRPEVEGIAGQLFALLGQIDRPYNLTPSLHIALRTILAATYARHTSGWLRIASHAWFSLIGFSTLFVYQHHVIDVVGGFMLATLCVYALREEAAQPLGSVNRRVASYYAAGAAAAGAVSLLGGWWAWAAWPALALALVARAYWCGDSSVYRKEAGRIPLSARIVLAPCLLGQDLSAHWYMLGHGLRRHPWDTVAPNVRIGRRLGHRKARAAVDDGVVAVLDLTAEFTAPSPFREVAHLNIPILDLTAPTDDQVRAALTFIERNVQHGLVYIHCKIGYSRSAAIAGAYLLAQGLERTPEGALARLRSARPSIIIRPEAEAVVRSWSTALPVGASATVRASRCRGAT